MNLPIERRRVFENGGHIDSPDADPFRRVKPHIIFNPTAGSVANVNQPLAKLKRLRPVAVAVTKRAGDAEKWARQAARAGCDFLIVAGGDGTLNEVVNGIA